MELIYLTKLGKYSHYLTRFNFPPSHHLVVKKFFQDSLIKNRFALRSN